MLIAYDKDKNRVSIRNTLINEKYYCPICNEELIQKKGSIRCHHFAHKAGGACVEKQYYDTSEWHINWQNKFPIDSQEVIRIDDKGKKHIADVLINKTVIEFQHSNLPFEEFNDRNIFWSNLGYRVIWVFDGNEIFNNGYSGGYLYFKSPLKPLKMISSIPDYLNIFIEGTMDYNLFEESGSFLYHVGDVDQETGISFNGKCELDKFYDKIMNNWDFDFKKDEYIDLDSLRKNNDRDIKIIEPKTLIELFEQNENTSKLVAYNQNSGYDFLIDRYNYERLKSRKKAYGKMKKHCYKKFLYNEKQEIYDSFASVWYYQWSITEEDEY